MHAYCVMRNEARCDAYQHVLVKEGERLVLQGELEKLLPGRRVKLRNACEDKLDISDTRRLDFDRVAVGIKGLPTILVPKLNGFREFGNQLLSGSTDFKPL